MLLTQYLKKMTSKLHKVYLAGLKDTEFVNAIKTADNDKKPNCFTSETEKLGFAMVYYGWLVAKYGDNWELSV